MKNFEEINRTFTVKKILNSFTDYGSRSWIDRVRTLYVDAVSLPSFCRVNHVLTLLVVMLFTIGVGNVWGADTELTFSLTSNPGGWPTTNSTTLTNYTYTLSGTNYTFALKNVKQNSGYLMLTSTAVLGLPAISGMTLTKVVVSNSGSCSTSTRVGISSSSSSASYISGGAYQTYSTPSSTYTYNLTGTSANTMYYLYVTNKNCQITQLKLTYSGGSTPTITTSVASLSEVGYSTADFSQQVKSFTVSGSNLTANVTVTAPTNYEVCKTSGGTYTSSVSFDKGSGTLAASTVYVRLQSGKTAGNYSGNVACSSSGATTKNVAVSGSVPFTVTWKANGTTHATTYVTYATGTGTALGSLPTDPDPSDYTCSPKAFYGWYDGVSYSDASIAPSIISTSTKITSDKTYNAVFATASGGAATWDKVTTLAGITAGTYVIINDSKYLPNTATSSAPAQGTAPTITGTQITGTVTDAMKWYFTSTGTANQFYIQNENDDYLYETNNNNGLRVGSTSDKWTFAANTLPAFSLQGENNSRYCATYKSGSDWRSYTSANAGNYGDGGKVYLYKLTGGTTYSAYSTTCAACNDNPSITGVSLLGSAFSTTSVLVQATGVSAGSNCSLSSYGFYWGTSASPSGNSTASNNLSAGTFSATLTGTFTIGTQYYYRAWATNNGGNTGYSSDGTFTLQNVTFNMHSHGGDAPATQVVPQGGKAANPGNPSETGWTFDGWWDNSSYTGSAWDFSTNTVGSGGVTLHAKWSEKPKYTITLNAGNGTISDANWTNTSGSTYTRTQSNGDEAITLPTPSCGCSGWVFQGWSTTAKDNAGSFTPDKEDGATFTPTSNVTYYAVYRENATSGNTYNKITSTGDLTTGNYMFVSSTSYAMQNTVNGTRMDEVSGFTSSNSSQTTDNSNLVWTIVKINSQVVIKNGANYIGINANNDICLTTTPHFFTYTYVAGSNRWEFTSATKTSYQLVYNSYFKIGASQTTAIYLYKQGAGLTGNYYTNPSCSEITVTGAVSPAGSGTVTLTAGSGKSGDKVYAMYTPDEDYNFNNWSIEGTGSSLGSTTAVVTEITIGSENTTVTANFVAKDWKTVTWKANGVTLTGEDLGSASVKVENGFNITALPPAPSPCDGTSTTFMGWVADGDEWSGKTDDVSDVTIYDDASDFPTVTANVTYHAVWARRSGSAAPATYAGTGVFTKITTMEELEVGAHYVLHGVKVADNSVNAAMNNTFSNPASGKYVFGGSAVTISDNKITNPATTIVWKLGGTTNAYTLYSQNSSKYVEITANDARAFSNPSSPTTSFTIDVNEGVFRIMSNHASASGRMISLYLATEFRSYANNNTDFVLYLYKYGSNYTYDQYLVKCCNTPTLAFGASPYAVLREDLGGVSNTDAKWAVLDVTFTSNNTTGTISATSYTDGKTVYKLNTWQSRATTGGTLCAKPTATANSGEAYFEVLTQPSGVTPGTGRFHVKTNTAGSLTGQGTYRIAITQAATDAEHGNFCETTVYGFVDVTLRDKFVDKLNNNGTKNRDGHGEQLTTPALSEFDTQVENACHAEGRKLKGWIKETDLKTLYENGSPASTRVQTIDGLCESCDAGSDEKTRVVAPGTDFTTSGATWYAVWAYEK